MNPRPVPHAQPFAAVAERIADALWTCKRAIVTAAPGSGKTTQLPLVLGALLRQRGDTRQIWVLEPRRIAARLAASYVAERCGSAVGERVGYRVRFEERAGPHTQIVYITYGLFARLLQSDPSLQGVAAVLFDEFHERNWQQDASLAALLALHQTPRVGPAIGILSATLDAERCAAYVGGAPIFSVSGTAFACTHEYAPAARQTSLEAHVAKVVRAQLAARPEGHVLVFLPGPKEIVTTQRLLSASCAPDGVAVLPLYARLPEAAQREALAPLNAPKRKVVLATNIAESSVTIDGVRIVIDSGLSLQAEQDPSSGIGTLRLGPISQASITQRAGRAARQAPGHVVRLFSAADHKRRPAFDPPELLRADLSEPWLWLLSIGLSPTDVSWLDAPPEGRSKAALQTLHSLGACTADGALTEMGRQLATLALHPRLGRVAVAAAHGGVPRAVLAGLLAILEDPHADDRARAQPPVLVPSDVEEALLRVRHVPRWQEASRQHEQWLRRLMPATPAPQVPDAIEQALLAGFVDRVARRLPPIGPKPGVLPLAMAHGGSAQLHETSGVRDAEFMLCLAGRVHTGPGAAGLRVTLAAGLDPARLLDAFPPWLHEQERTVLTPGGRVMRQHTVTFAGLSLLESESVEACPQRRAQALSGALLAIWRQQHTLDKPREALQARLDWLRRVRPALATDMAGIDLDARLATTLLEFAHGALSLRDIAADDVWATMAAALPDAVTRALQTDAPTHVRLAGGKRLAVHWQLQKPPYVASFLQDFAGQDTALVLGDSLHRLTVHLWAPNRRPLQITDDLQSFWQTHYPSLKNQLSRRYPRHQWP